MSFPLSAFVKTSNNINLEINFHLDLVDQPSLWDEIFYYFIILHVWQI